MNKLLDKSVVDGFDPLMEADHGVEHIQLLLKDSRKRDVLNILRSYTGTFDVFAEALQNAIDAVEKKKMEFGGSYNPKIWVNIDITNSQIKIIDNGVGMDLNQFLYSPRPNVSFKKRAEFRGHKGVGATFLAYGFTVFRIQTKQGDSRIAGSLAGGRQWAEDTTHVVPKPVFKEFAFDVPELEAETSGTCVEIVIGDHRDERPNLKWLQAFTAKQWKIILRLKTALGGVYLHTPAFSPSYIINVVAPDGMKTSEKGIGLEYYWPHEFEIINKCQSLSDINGAISKIDGDLKTKIRKLDNEFKRLDCIWEIWDTSQILDEKSPFRIGKNVIDDDREELIRTHSVCIYGSFFKSKTLWDKFLKDELSIHGNVKVASGGLQIASDHMSQGDLMIIPLTGAAGYQAFAHIVVHFTDGNPDVGRKIFQPELKALAEFLAVKSVGEFRKYESHLGADTGSSQSISSAKLHEYKKAQEQYQERNPLNVIVNNKRISIISRPQEEQDVIALYNQLLGSEFIQGIKFYATEYNERYDGLFMFDYRSDGQELYFSETNPLGVNPDYKGNNIYSDPKVIEYKYTFDALYWDITKEVKHISEIDFVVCWSAGKDYMRQFELQCLLVGDEGATRQIFGSTHKAFAEGMGNQPLFEVLILEDLIDYLNNKDQALAHFKTKYT